MQRQQLEQELSVTDSVTFLLEPQVPSLFPAGNSELMKIMHCILSVMQMEAII